MQRLKGALAAKSPKTVNNVLTVLIVLLKTAASWNVIDRMPCTIRLLRVTTGSAAFLDVEDYDRLLDAARRDSSTAHVITFLKGHVTATKGGRVRYVPLTVRLATALKDARRVGVTRWSATRAGNGSRRRWCSSSCVVSRGGRG